MMLTIMIILLAWDDEGITLKLHSHGRLLEVRVPSQEFAMGGGVQRCETKLKEFIFGIERFFCPKLGEKSLHLDLVQFFAQS